MILQIVSFPNFLDSCILRINIAQTVTQKSRHHRVITRCKVNNNNDVQPTLIGAAYKPTSWSHNFIMGLETNSPIKSEKKVQELEEQVTMMIINSENGGTSTVELLELVDDIERLGLGYRFHNTIARVLNDIATINASNLGVEGEDDEDIYIASLKFRLLRQHSYTVSQDFLRRFKDSQGRLTGCLKTDVKTLLSVYEASYIGLEGETDLHEVKILATEQLLLKINSSHEHDLIKDHVKQALDIPLYRRMRRLDSRWYIDAYSKRKDANRLLLDLAILDFNMVQSTYKKDLQEVSKWWENLGLTRKMSFIRDRVMECYFVSVAALFEPQYFSCRVGLTKICNLIACTDDIYDVYGSLDELKVFTNAVKRWDVNAVKSMPEYLQVAFLALFNTINEMGYNILMSQGENIIPILAKVWGELLEAFTVEAEWNKSHYMPTIEEYLDNGLRSASQVVVLTHGYFLMNQDVKNDTIESLERFHDLFKWSSMISRLCNDLSISVADEMSRGKTVNAITCYTHQYGVCEEVAREYIRSLTEKTWMKMIEARCAISSNESTDPFIDMAINLTRFSHCMYQYGDALAAPDARAKDSVASVIIEPITYSR